MQLPIVFLLAAGVAVAVVAIVLTARRKQRERRDAVQQAALSLGFSFEAEGDLAQITALADLPLFHHGHSKKVRNLLAGHAGDHDLRVFDYLYTIGGGDNSHTFRQTVALYPGAGRALPDFFLRPEHALHKVGEMFGYQDIDFESSPVFSSKYLLRGQDETAIRSAFTSEARAFLEQQPGWTVEVQAGNVGIYRAGKRCRPEETGTFIEETRGVLHALAVR